MSKCPNCHSNDTNTKKGNIKALAWTAGGIFLAVTLTCLNKGFGFIITGVLVSAALYFFGKKRVVYNYYCNNCITKWTNYDWE